jgi:hypothetical protein
MTEELASMLKRYVDAPGPLEVSVGDVVSRGRRRRRARTALTVVPVAAAVAAVAVGITAVSGVHHDEQVQGRPSTQPQAREKPLESLQMPAFITTLLHRELGPGTEEFAPPTAFSWQVTPTDYQTELQGDDRAGATEWSANFKRGEVMLGFDSTIIPPDEPARLRIRPCQQDHDDATCRQFRLPDGRAGIVTTSYNGSQPLRLREAVLDVYIETRDRRVGFGEVIKRPRVHSADQHWPVPPSRLVHLAADPRLLFVRSGPLPPLPSGDFCIVHVQAPGCPG